MPTKWACACACRGLKVPLLPDQLWKKTEQGRPEIFVEVLPLLVLDPKHWFDLRAWIVFHEGAPRPIRRARVGGKKKLVIPGGQFESNRLPVITILFDKVQRSLEAQGNVTATTSSNAPRIPSAAIRAVCQARHGLEDFAVKFGVPDEV